jgi:hypothetical protein
MVCIFKGSKVNVCLRALILRHGPGLSVSRLSLLVTTLMYGLTLFVAGCSPVALSLEHKIEIPPAYSSPEPTEAGVSPVQRYRAAYERGWWNCIAERIRVVEEPCRNIASGWPSEVFGYVDGSTAADERVKQLLDSYGKDRTLSCLISEHNRRAASSEQKKKP